MIEMIKSEDASKEQKVKDTEWKSPDSGKRKWDWDSPDSSLTRLKWRN